MNEAIMELYENVRNNIQVVENYRCRFRNSFPARNKLQRNILAQIEEETKTIEADLLNLVNLLYDLSLCETEDDFEIFLNKERDLAGVK